MKTNNSIKVLICVLLAVAIGFSFMGCNFGVASNKPSMATTEQVDEGTSEEASTTKASTTTSTTTDTTTSTTASTTTSTTESTTAAKIELQKANTPKLTTAPTTTKKNSKNKNKKTTTKSGYVTISISCFELINNKDSVQKGYEAYIPSSGYIIKNYKTNINEAENVYIALKSACNAKGVSVDEKVSTYGIYINSINHLDENVLGNKAGGWTYYVNGSYPMKSVDSYKLKAGDNVEFKYAKVN